MQFKNFTTFCLMLLGLVGFTAAATAQVTVLLSEDFDGAIPAEWTSNVVSGSGGDFEAWLWTDVGATGAFAIDPIASTSAANGWIMFDSDSDCSQTTQDAWLISPAFDASAESTVWINFDTWYRSFNDRPQVRVGTDLDSLHNWATYEVFPGIGSNDFAEANPTRMQIDISDDAAGESNVYVAFQFLSDSETGNGGNLTGCAYSWHVDDVEVNNFDPRDDHDGQVNDFYAIPSNFLTPASQVGPIGFLADIENIGRQTLDTMTLTVNISDQTSTVYTNSLDYIAVASDSVAENVPFAGTFTPPAQPGVYFGTYTLTTSPDDQNAETNTQSFNFIVTDTVFSKGEQATAAFTASGDNSVSFGSIFYVPNGAGYYARYTSFDINNEADLVGQSVTLKLLKWNGDDEDGRISPEEYNDGPVGGNALNSYTFTGQEDGFITVPISFEGVGIPLEDDSYYIMTMEFESTDGSSTVQLLADGTKNYNATSLLGDSLMMKRFASCADVGLTGEFFVNGFGLDSPSIIGMSVGDNADLAAPAITSTQEPTLAAGSVKAFPNPASQQFTLEINLEETVQNVELYIYDMMGRVITTDNIENVRQASLDFVTKDLANGQYYVRVRTELGVATVPFTVAH